MEAKNGICFLGKILTLILLCATFSFANEVKIVNDSTIVSTLTKKYESITSYYAKFEGKEMKGEIYYKSPGLYFVKDNNFNSIINGAVTYKTQPAMQQTIISKTDGTFNMYSPIGLVTMLNSNFNFTSYDSTTSKFTFTAKDKYDYISSAVIEFTKEYMPKNVTVQTNDGQSMTYSTSEHKINKKISADKFIYTKIKDFEEIDLR